MKTLFRSIGAAAALLAAGGCGNPAAIDLVIGTYGENIHLYSFDCESLEFTSKGMVEARNASYAIENEGSIFAVSECGGDSGVYSFKDGETTDLRQTGADPCFILLHEGHMMTADYSGGSVSVFPIRDGVLEERCAQLSFTGSGPVADRQESSHIHQLKVVPGMNNHILATDLGADVIHILEFTPSDTASLLRHVSDIPCPPGSGQRHMEFGKGKNGLMLYCIAELSGEVLVYQASDGFRLVQRIQADEANAGGSADIHIHPSGRWLYTSHRLENDGISIFSINEDGTLVKSSYMNTGRHPRNFMITEDGNFLLVACRDDRMIQVFRIGKDGGLIPTEAVLHLESDMPSSITATTPALSAKPFPTCSERPR